MDLLNRIRERWAPPSVDRERLREEMKRNDPSFKRVSDVQHDALGALTAVRLADGVAIRRERIFWSQHGGSPPKKHDDDA
jgi:hypothetical protein